MPAGDDQQRQSEFEAAVVVVYHGCEDIIIVPQHHQWHTEDVIILIVRSALSGSGTVPVPAGRFEGCWLPQTPHTSLHLLADLKEVGESAVCERSRARASAGLRRPLRLYSESL